MADTKTSVYRNFRFKVMIENLDDSIELGEASFNEITGMDATYDVIEYREGDDILITPEKYSGLLKYSNITLSRGMTDSIDFFMWISQAIQTGSFLSGTNQKSDMADSATKVAINLLGDDGQEIIATWELSQAWPVKYVGPDFKGNASEIAIEKLELAHRGVTRIL